MRSMANRKVTGRQTVSRPATQEWRADESPGLIYIRKNRSFDQRLYDSGEYGFEIGKAVQLAERDPLTIIVCGSRAFQALEAAKILNSADGIKAGV